jgi:hypothetical protein
MATTAPDLTAPADAGSSRYDRLTAAVRALRTRASGTDPARALMIAGSILVPLGGVLIILGWWGASHTVWVYEQIPYAISGGLLGLGLVFAGGFCYFAYWLTQIVHVVRRDAQETRAVLTRIEDLLAAAPAAAAITDDGAPVAAAAVAPAPGFLATANGTVFHRPDCAAVAGRDAVRAVSADDGLAPCRICEPLGG